MSQCSRGAWKWQPLEGRSYDDIRIPILEEVQLIKTARAAFQTQDYMLAVAKAIAALELYPESYLAHRLVATCSLLHSAPVDPEFLTRSARFVHDRDLVIQKAILFFRQLAAANPDDKARPIVETHVELFEAERVQNSGLLDAIREFLNKPLSVCRASGSGNDGDYSTLIALVFNAPRCSAGRVKEIGMILNHPDLARLVHQIADRIGGDDLKARDRVQQASGPAIARLIKSFGTGPTMEELVAYAEQKLEGLIKERMARQPDDRDKNNCNMLPDDVRREHDGRLVQNHNPRKRPPRNGDND
ncbi:MAG: hypothetical protein KA354_19730 [Phycisphaerae bacterium]|nr:hypothetical protein [Phycisphaerae bacterium]